MMFVYEPPSIYVATHATLLALDAFEEPRLEYGLPAPKAEK